MSIEFQCPHCHSYFRTKSEHAGRSTRCRKCQKLIDIKALPPKKYIQFKCGKCDSVFKTTDNFIGRQTRCRNCYEPLTIEAIPDGEVDLDQALEQAPGSGWDAGSTDDAPLKFIEDDKDVPLEEVTSITPKPKASREITADDITPMTAPGLAPPRLPPANLPVPEVVQSTLPRAASPHEFGKRGQKANTRDSGDPGLAVGLILLFLAALFISTIQAVVYGPNQAFKRGGEPPESWIYWMISLFMLVAFFVVVVPINLLAPFVTSKIFRFRLPVGSYFNTAACVSVMFAYVLVGAGNVDVLGIVGALILLLLLLALVYVLIAKLFTMNHAEAATTMALGIVTMVVGTILGLILVVAMAAPMVANAKARKLAADLRAKEEAADAARQSAMVSNNPTTPNRNGFVPPKIDAGAQAVLTGLRDMRASIQFMIDNKVVRNSETDTQFEAYRKFVYGAAGQYPNDSNIVQFHTELAAIETQYLALETGQPGAEVFRAFEGGELWTLDGDVRRDIGPEMKFAENLAIRVPSTAQMDLEALQNNRYVWRSPNKDVILTINRRPRKDAKQLRPWVVSPGKAAVAEESGLMYVVSDESKQTTGRIGTLQFVRGQRAPSDPTKGVDVGRVRYVALDKDQWLVADITGQDLNSEWAHQFERSIRSLRVIGEKENIAGPLDPESIVHRLADIPDEAEKALIEKGAAAEDPLLSVIQSPDTSPAVRARALDILSKVGTEKSKIVLWRLAKSDDPAASETARRGLMRIDPTRASPGTFALSDLGNATDAKVRQRGADVLSRTKAEPAIREDVARALWLILSNPNKEQQDKALVNSCGDAFRIWYSSRTTDQVVTFLGAAENADHPNLDAVIISAGAIKDKRIPFAVTRWLLKSPTAVKAACVQIGAPAEEELLKLLNRRDDNERGQVIDILAEVGGAKSIGPLDAIQRQGGPLQARVGEALRQIKSREASKR